MTLKTRLTIFLGDARRNATTQQLINTPKKVMSKKGNWPVNGMFISTLPHVWVDGMVAHVITDSEWIPRSPKRAYAGIDYTEGDYLLTGTYNPGDDSVTVTVQQFIVGHRDPVDTCVSNAMYGRILDQYQLTCDRLKKAAQWVGKPLAPNWATRWFGKIKSLI